MKKVKRRERNRSFVIIVVLFALAILLVAYMGYVRSLPSEEPTVKCESIDGVIDMSGVQQVITPDSTNFRYDYTGFTVYFNPRWRVPSVVVYELTQQELEGNESRAKKYFKPDKSVELSANTKDYVKSGYDRGHMAPAADMNWDTEVMKQSFLMTNIAPQNGNLNSGDWRGVESKIRKWCERDSALVIITGTIFDDANVKTIGANNVGVPSKLYKIVFAPYVEKPRMVAYLFNNREPMRSIAEHLVTVDSIEQITGNDFFSTLPDEFENQLESVTNIEQWNRQ